MNTYRTLYNNIPWPDESDKLTFQIVEVNSELLLQIDRAGWHSLRAGLTCPCHVVVIRNISPPPSREIGETLGLCDQRHDRLYSANVFYLLIMTILHNLETFLPLIGDVTLGKSVVTTTYHNKTAIIYNLRIQSLFPTLKI